MIIPLGVDFDGFRLITGGFEVGSMKLSLSDVERKGLTGKILQANWKANWKVTKTIVDTPISIAVLLEKEALSGSLYFKFRRITVISNETVLYELCNKYNDLYTIQHGEYCALTTVNPTGLLASLERIANVFETFQGREKPSCTLYIIPTAAISNNPSLVLFGAAGALISAGTDAYKRNKLHDQLKNGKVFGDEMAEQLIDFLDKKGWIISVG